LNINLNIKNMNVKPLADRVLVEPAQAETTTASGIIIPDTAQEKPQKGTIVAVGDGKKDEPLSVKVGDTVLYGKYSGTELKYEGKDYMIMRESDILAII
jgi:chaperonin GroES